MDRIGRYQIVGELGRGAMGVVYHAVDPNIGRPVAIKTIRLTEVQNAQEQSKLRERLFREARSAGMLSHPGIVTIYDVEEHEDVAYIAMEFVDGPTLDHLLSEDRALPAETMFSVLGQTAVALDYAHSKGIVHRDIKPANIMIARDGTCKITDFGIAKITASEQFTMTGSIVGTPHYMSPEQVQGKPVDGHSDQFSLAVIAYEILTGEKPYTGEHLTTVVYKIVAEDYPAPHRINPSLSGQIEAVLRKGLAKKPDLRYRTCSEFVEALEKACAASPGWKSMMRGGSLELPTVADAPKPPVLPPPKHPRRAGASTASVDAEPKKKSGFLPFLAAILVAAGLLALIGWQAAPWLAQQTAQAPSTQPAPTPAPAAQTTPPAAPPAAQTAAGEADKPSALAPAQAPVVEPAAPEPEPEAEKAAPAPRRTPQPPRPAPAARTTPVSVASSPAGASVSVDGQHVCTSPCTVETPQGRHTFTLTLAGHQSESREVTVTGNPQELSLITLRAAAGTLMVTSSPTGAAVLINGKSSKYHTPAQISLAPGSYQITIEKDGRQASRRVDVRNGAINYLKITME
jgi:serine/threonine-protein kinase